MAGAPHSQPGSIPLSIAHPCKAGRVFEPCGRSREMVLAPFIEIYPGFASTKSLQGREDPRRVRTWE